MALTAEAIIEEVNRLYPPRLAGKIGNCSDLNIGASVKNIDQFVIGLIPGKNHNDVEHYQLHMQNQLFELNAKVKCLAWRFNGDEQAEIQSVLSELATAFRAELVIEKMVKTAYTTKSDWHYIVITAVTVKILQCS